MAWRELALHAGDLTTFVGTRPEPGCGGANRHLLRESVPELGAGLCVRYDWSLGICPAARPLPSEEPAAWRALGPAWQPLRSLGCSSISPVTTRSPTFRRSGALRETIAIAIALGYPFFLAAVLICLPLTAERIQRPVTASPVRWIGDISYAIYLIHFAVIWFALQRALLASAAASSASALAWSRDRLSGVAIAYAYLSARFLERPIRRWAQRYGRRAQEARRAQGHGRGVARLPVPSRP